MDGLLGDALVAASLSVRLLLDLAPDLVEVQELLVARVQEFGPFAISEVMVSKIYVSNHAQYLVNLVPKSSFQFLALLEFFKQLCELNY